MLCEALSGSYKYLDIFPKVLKFTKFTIILHASGDLRPPAIRHETGSLYMVGRLITASMRRDRQGHYIVITQETQAETRSDTGLQGVPNPGLLGANTEHLAAAAGNVAYVDSALE
jgi:hypothetical protein